MGAQNSNLRKSIEDEFASRIARTGRDWLRLGDVLDLQLPHCGWSINLAHLGVLFVLDKEHDGRFTLSNVLDMLEFGREQSRLHQPYELAAQMSGFCTLQMWQALSQEGGVPNFVEWLCTLLQGPPAHAVLRKYPDKSFVNRKSLRLLHKVLDIQGFQQMSFQGFFEKLQCHAEADGEMDPVDELLDDWVPLSTFKVLARSLGEGIVLTANQMCPITQ